MPSAEFGAIACMLQHLTQGHSSSHVVTEVLKDGATELEYQSLAVSLLILFTVANVYCRFFLMGDCAAV